MKKENLIKFAPKKEVIWTVLSLLWMWFAYYTSNTIFEGNMLYTIVVSMILTLLVVNVGFPAWWVIVHNNEGLKGLGITTKRLGLSLLFTVLLAAWRFLELRSYIGNSNLVNNLLMNGISVYEVFFIYGWLFTRYEKSFGKIPAIILTAISTGVYHIGTMTPQYILHLCLVILICAACYAITENIFTLWPIYWTIGTTASTIKAGVVVPIEMVVLAGIATLIHITWIIFMQHIYAKRKQSSVAV